jgi:hypothetical protein
MIGFNLLPLLAPARKGFDGFSKWLWEPLGTEPTAVSREPAVHVVEPSPIIPKPKRRRARGRRMAGGCNKAVARALAAAGLYHNEGGTLAAAAAVCGANVPYTRAVLHLQRSGQEALLHATCWGDIPLLKAVRTDTAATITVINNG